MKVLIVGSGGREHAIAWSVSKSPKVDKIYNSYSCWNMATAIPLALDGGLR